jgi:DNA-binding PadR family transcriptional regulator
MMPLRPGRGGFLRPFGCGWFIREFLMGRGPEGSLKIDPEVGACQEDIFYHYKKALHRAYAEDAIAWENEERIRHEKPIYTEQEWMERFEYFMSRIPYKLFKCRYHSFQRYFHWLKQLGWVEFTGKEETASMQDFCPEAPPRRYYRLTEKGINAPDYEWSNPQLTLYPERPLEYFREKRRQRKYARKAPTRSRRARQSSS